MNIKLSYSWLKELAPTRLPAEEFARRLSEAGMGVERIERPAVALENIVVATITEITKHPNADKLQIAIVDAGAERFSVVCGGTNLKIGMKVAMAKIGARVRWHGEGETVELAPAEIRGVKSFGMICAAAEIGLASWFTHAEREILDLGWLKAKDGTPLSEALGLDEVFDIEVTTNRPDALSAIGIAREAATILKGKLIWQDGAVELKKIKPIKSAMPLQVKVHDKKFCPRYQAAVIDGVKIGPSPFWLQKRLFEAGLRPISNIVDITNYLMLLTGQPMHAFDYRKLAGGAIEVREAKKGEKLRALDGRDYELQPGMLVIADAKKPVAIAGVIGGEETAVGVETKTVVFESANFDPVSVRRTSRVLGLHTDSSLRFEKGLGTEGTGDALYRAIQLSGELAEGRPGSAVFDLRAARYKPLVYPFDPKRAEDEIGIPIAVSEMLAILRALGFTPKKRGRNFTVAVPWWRDRDVQNQRDFSEEIARITGYKNLPSILPAGVPPLRAVDPEIKLADQIKTVLAGAGATELYTYSFVSEELLALVSAPGVKPVRLLNPLSADFAAMRTSLIPSLLAVIRDFESERSEATFFEISRVYLDKSGGLPEEPLELLAACAGGSSSGEEFFRAKNLAETAVNAIGAKSEWRRAEKFDKALWHPGRVAELFVDGDLLGTLGEIHPELLKRVGIEKRVAIFTAPLSRLVSARRPRSFESPLLFPAVKRDLSFTIDARREYAEIVKAISSVSESIRAVELFDTYQGQGVPQNKKSMAFHLAIGAADRTLKAGEADALLEQVVKKLQSDFGAEMRR